MANEAWSEVDRLISEDQYEAASQRVAEIRDAARQQGDDDNWTRALVREVQLRTALGAFETAVRDLKVSEWPESPRHRATLRLYYAHALTTYLDGYSWEIRQRERVESAEEVDLKKWTADQIYSEAEDAYRAVWAERESWGDGPIGPLAEVLEQNSYPPRIRGTLRDTISYLWAELLGNSSYWGPEDSNEIFRLDLETLLSTDPAAGQDLTATETHPLTKLTAVLADLESWHRGANRPEAAFEARLNRLERLWGQLSEKEDRARLVADLEAEVEDLGRRYEWWSVGMARLAQWLQEGSDPNRLDHARTVALKGRRAHPDSVGGRQCNSIVAAIEAPSYSLTAMASDGLDRRSIEISHKNLAALHFRAYRVDLGRTVEGAKDYNLLPDHRAVERIVAKQIPDLTWSVELPETPDYLPHRTFVTPPVERVGAYLVVASTRRDFKRRGNLLQGVNLVLGDLVLLARGVEDGYELTTRSGASGAALPGVEVSLYRFDWQRGHQRAGRELSDEQGRVRFSVPAGRGGGYFALARKGEDVALEPRLGHPRPKVREHSRTATLVYTDRAVYRPLQEVLWKIVVYRGLAGEFETQPGEEVEVILYDPNRQEADKVKVTTNEFGTASGRFTIPAGRLLGAWSVNASTRGAAQLRVEEYKRPTFEVTLLDSEEPLRLNREATLTGEVRYYFGLPVTAGQAAWRVTREPIYPRWWWWFEPRSGQVQTIAQGASELDADGRFRVTFSPEADERQAERGVTYRYRLAADVTDEGGETRSASRGFRLGFTAIEATIQADAGFERSDRATRLAIRRTDLEGVPRAGTGGWRLVELAQPERARLPSELPVRRAQEEDDAYTTEGDRLRPRWAPAERLETILGAWQDGAEQASGDLRHGDDGLAELVLGRLPAGAYRLYYTTEDDFGSPYETRHELVVADGEERRSRGRALPAPPD